MACTTSNAYPSSHPQQPQCPHIIIVKNPEKDKQRPCVTLLTTHQTGNSDVAPPYPQSCMTDRRHHPPYLAATDKPSLSNRTHSIRRLLKERRGDLRAGEICGALESLRGLRAGTKVVGSLTSAPCGMMHGG